MILNGLSQIEKDLNLKASTISDKGGAGKWDFYKSVYEAAENSDGIVVLTEWEEFKYIDWIKDIKSHKRSSLDI